MCVEYKEVTEKIFIISVISLFCIKIFKDMRSMNFKIASVKKKKKKELEQF